MNEVRTFRARTLHDALNVVRRELGTEAVILRTRQAPTSRIWPWARRDVEVTARTYPNAAVRTESPRVENRLQPDSDVIRVSGAQSAGVSSDSKSTSDFSEQILSLQQLLGQLTERTEPKAHELSGKLEILYGRLLKTGIPDETARQCVTQLQLILKSHEQR